MSCAAFFQLTLVTFRYNDCVLLRGGWGGGGGVRAMLEKLCTSANAFVPISPTTNHYSFY